MTRSEMLQALLAESLDSTVVVLLESKNGVAVWGSGGVDVADQVRKFNSLLNSVYPVQEKAKG